MLIIKRKDIPEELCNLAPSPYDYPPALFLSHLIFFFFLIKLMPEVLLKKLREEGAMSSISFIINGCVRRNQP